MTQSATARFLYEAAILTKSFQNRIDFGCALFGCAEIDVSINEKIAPADLM